MGRTRMLLKRTAGRSGGRIRIAVDIGGTFTDGVANLMPGGRIWVAKRLTTPDDPGRAVSTVIGELLEELGRDHPGVDPAALVVEVVHGTTLGANAILERKGAKVGLLVTKGTGDALDIRREIRYDIYDLNLELPQPLVPRTHREEIAERLDRAGLELLLEERLVLLGVDDRGRETQSRFGGDLADDFHGPGDVRIAAGAAGRAEEHGYPTLDPAFDHKP